MSAASASASRPLMPGLRIVGTLLRADAPPSVCQAPLRSGAATARVGLDLGGKGAVHEEGNHSVGHARGARGAAGSRDWSRGGQVRSQAEPVGAAVELAA